MLTWILFITIAAGPGYLIMRRHVGIGWGVLSYFIGLLVPFAPGVGSMYLEERNGIPPGQSGKLLGIAIWCGVLAPGLGLWLGRRSRSGPKISS